jgi:hypothetical protein
MSETTSEVKEYDNAAEVLDIEAAIVQLDIVDDELISSVACDERAESDLATAEVLTRTTLDNWANPTVIGPNNKEIHKRKLASMINKDRCVTSKSMDRKYRVQGVARHGARNGDRDDSWHKGPIWHNEAFIIFELLLNRRRVNANRIALQKII